MYVNTFEFYKIEKFKKHLDFNLLYNKIKEEIKEDPKAVLDETINGVKEKISNIVDYNDFDNIDIVEEEIVISKTFGDEGDIK